MTDTNPSEPQYLAHARYLGADAAMASATWLEVSDKDAASILSDVDPEVLERYGSGPDLSGQWAGDPTPVSIARDVGANDGDLAFWGPDLVDEISTAWEEGVSDVWGDALQAHALRTLGRVDDALRLERDLETRVSAMRQEAGQ